MSNASQFLGTSKISVTVDEDDCFVVCAPCRTLVHVVFPRLPLDHLTRCVVSQIMRCTLQVERPVWVGADCLQPLWPQYLGTEIQDWRNTK